MSIKIKNFHLNIPIILLCVVIVFASALFIKASSPAQVQFTADTIISLSGIDDGDLYIRTNSECAEINISGSTLTITDIPIANNFILKTTHSNALKLTPTGGVLDLTLDSGNISSGNITQWTLNASSGTTVAHIVGVASANTWYAIKTDGVLFNTFQSNSSGEVSFTYDGSWSEKVFTIELDETNPTSFSLIAPINNSSTSDSSPTFSWNACSDSDLSHYQLYINNNLDTDNITGTSTIPTNSLSCGSHTWYIKAIDNAGLSTDSETFNLTMACGSGLPPSASNPPILPEPTPENQEGGFGVVINSGAEYTDNKTVTLKLNAGSDTARMAISNMEDFGYASQVPYQEEIEWELSSTCHCEEERRSNPATTREELNDGIAASPCGTPRNDSVCAVYVKFYTQYGVASEVVSDSIIYTNKSNPDISEGSLIRANDDYKVYIIKNNYKRHILDERIFDFYGHLNWESIQEVSSSQANNYQESFLIREANGYKVYKIENDKKRWLNMTAEDFINKGYSWDEVYIINEEELGWYGNIGY